MVSDNVRCGDVDDDEDSPCHKCKQLPALAGINSRTADQDRVCFGRYCSFRTAGRMIAEQSVLSESGGASNLTLGGVEHKSLIKTTETVDFGFSSLQPHLELLLDGFEVPDMAGS